MDNSHFEDEARELWCPHFTEKMRAALTTNAAPGTCIASECSQWQWAASQYLFDDGTGKRGYCGLARGR